MKVNGQHAIGPGGQREAGGAEPGLKVGHATRSVDECVRLAKADMTIRTALLESRWIWGDQPLARDFQKRFREEVVDGTGMAFVEAKFTH